jgi:iron(III) transport system substrate-binding protein
MPSPLESGTALTTVLQLHKLYGEDYFKGLRANGAVAAGGNGAALARLQSGEFPVGMVLMENVLQAWEKQQNSVVFTVPEEGGVAVPSPMAIFKSSKEPELAQQILAWFMSAEAQNILVKGWVYSVVPGSPAPAKAPAWDALKMMPWTLGELETLGKQRQSVKDAFQKLVLQ